MNNTDIIENFNGNIIQHGKYNDRVYLIKLVNNNIDKTINKIESLRKKNKYTKIFIKIPNDLLPVFIKDNYLIEGIVPDLFSGKKDGFFLSKFFSIKRASIPKNELKYFYNTVFAINNKKKILRLNKNFIIKKATIKDAKIMADLYKKIFISYPFPIYDPNYILETMNNNVLYFSIWHNNKLIALSSSEIDYENKNAEMTDFAVLPEYRGNNLAKILLKKMEKVMKKIGIKTTYTIARLKSIGINLTFKSLDYKYSGTLINNTNISGNLESMNIWYKKL